METQELDQMKMKAMQEVSEMNLMVAGMKAELAKLQGEKEDFLKDRENEVMGLVDQLLKDSQQMLEETKSNYSLIHEFYETLKSFSAYIKEGQNALEEVFQDFKLTSEAVEIELIRKIKEVEQERKLLAIERTGIEKDKAYIKQQTAEIERQKALISSRQQQIKSALDTLKRKNNGT